MPSLLDYDSGAGYFDHLGALAKGAAEEVTAITALKARRDAIVALFPGTQNAWIQATINNLQARIDAGVQRMIDYRTDAEALTIQFVNATIPLPALSVQAALEAIALDMLAGSECIQGNTTGSGTATAASGNTGDAVPAASVANDATSTYQRYFDYLPAETLTIECVDAGDRSATGIQIYRVTGEASLDGMDPDWPGGSGIDALIPGIDAGVEEQTAFWRNCLRKGGFNSFTGSTPDGWSAASGTPATDFDGVGSGYKGANALRAKNGGGAFELRQQVNSSSAQGTTAQMFPKQTYFFALAAKVSSGGGTGGFTFGSNLASWGTANASALSASYVMKTFFTRTLAVTPTYVRISGSGVDRDIDINEFRLAPIPPLSPGGPYVAVAQGATASVLGDKWTIAITNNWAGVFAQWMERFFGLRRRGIIIPNSIGAPTISDALVA